MPRHPQAAKSARREFLESLLWAVAVALLIRTFVIAPFKIPSGSMRPTLMEGDRILVSKFIYRFHEPQRGDIIVFRYPEDPKRPFIKRLAGLGGEALEIRDGRLVINGTPLAGHSVLTDIAYLNRGSFGEEGRQIEIPPGQLYVLGDNTSFSHDSRFWGFVPRRLLIGRALCIFWPLNRIRLLR